MKQAARGTWNFVGKPAALAQGSASEAHLKHGCEYAPVAGRIRNFIEILSAPCRLAVASASGGQCRYPVKAGGKTVYYKQNAYLRTMAFPVTKGTPPMTATIDLFWFGLF